MTPSGLTHKALTWSNFFRYKRFVSALEHVETVQSRKLKNLLRMAQGTPVANRLGLDRIDSWKDFSSRLPITGYADWEPWVLSQRDSRTKTLSRSPCRFYQPTSGSTHTSKWIPYTELFLQELDCAFSPWFYDLQRQYPAMGRGAHYWSLSWIPDDLRDQNFVFNEMDLFPFFKRRWLHRSAAVPAPISRTQHSQSSLLATLVYLAAQRRLTMISVWSPTFLLSLLESLSARREELSEILGSGRWGTWESSMNGLPCPRSTDVSRLLHSWDARIGPEFLKNLWPHLALISAWDSSTSSLWAQDLKELFSHVSFQGKGLWATEGVVTIPFQGQYLLAVNSHFYEFRCLDSGKIFPSWELRGGQRVQPLLSTGSGLWRYALQDSMKVVGNVASCPTLLFEGRIDETDMVGEKIGHDLARHVLEDLNARDSSRCMTLCAIADRERKPFYAVLAQSQTGNGSDLAETLEKMLVKSHHYRLARELGQLGPAQVFLTKAPIAAYLRFKGQKEMISGNVKIEPLILLDHFPSSQELDP